MELPAAPRGWLTEKPGPNMEERLVDVTVSETLALQGLGKGPIPPEAARAWGCWVQQGRTAAGEVGGDPALTQDAWYSAGK